MGTNFNWPHFRQIEVWDMGRKLMQINFRVLEGSDQLPAFDDCVWYMQRPYTLEVIVHGADEHIFADEICDGELDRLDHLGDHRNCIGRYVYHEEGSDITIKNSACEMSLRVWRDPSTHGIRAEVTDQKVKVSRPQWGRLWRRPKPLAA